MRVVDAFWDLRNLGVSTQEAIGEPGDSPASVIATLSSLTAEYQVVKINFSQVELAQTIEGAGFHFIEAMVMIDAKIDNWPGELPEFRVLDATGLERLREAIRGGLFHTDRIFNDPWLGPKKSATRYVNYLQDHLDRGAVPIAVMHDGREVGFTIIHKTDLGEYAASLSGIFPDELSKGYSPLIVGSGLAYVKSLGYDKIISGVSSNNLASLRGHMKGGYLPHDITYIFIKHQPTK